MNIETDTDTGIDLKKTDTRTASLRGGPVVYQLIVGRLTQLLLQIAMYTNGYAQLCRTKDFST